MPPEATFANDSITQLPGDILNRLGKLPLRQEDHELVSNQQSRRQTKSDESTKLPRTSSDRNLLDNRQRQAVEDMWSCKPSANNVPKVER